MARMCCCPMDESYSSVGRATLARARTPSTSHKRNLATSPARYRACADHRDLGREALVADPLVWPFLCLANIPITRERALHVRRLVRGDDTDSRLLTYTGAGWRLD